MNPTTPRRMDGYIRVSSVGERDVESESYQTEAIQREKIEGWSKQRGIEIVQWHVDRDVSGAGLERLDKCLERIRRRETDGIVVAQVDRLSRANVADALLTVRQIHDEYGGTLVALDLGIDPTTEVGEMLLTVLLALARMQWRRYQAAWATSRVRAAARGAQMTRAPLGYRHAEDGGGRLEPDPVLGPVIAEMFRVAAVDGARPARDYVRQADPGAGNRWSLPNVRRTLARRVYLGETHWNGHVVEGAHEPLTDLATWTRAQSARPGRAPAGDFPLSGVPRCGSCGTAMVGTRSGGRRKYRCGSGGGLKRPVHCERRAWADAEGLEQFLLELLVLEVEAREADPESHPEVLPNVPRDAAIAVTEAELELDSARLRRTEFAEAALEVSPEAWSARAKALDAAVARAEERYADVLRASGPAAVTPTSVEVREAGIQGVAGFLERLGLDVKVEAGTAQVAQRVHLVPLG